MAGTLYREAVDALTGAHGGRFGRADLAGAVVHEARASLPGPFLDAWGALC